MWNLFGVMVFKRSIVNWIWGSRCILSIYAFCYMWHWFGVMVFHRSIMNWRCGGRCILSICVFCSLWELFGVTVFHRFIVNWSWGYMYPQYIWILLYVTLICCNIIPYIYCQLRCCRRGTCILSIFAFCHMWHLFGVMVFHIYILSIVEGGRCILSICAFPYMWNVFGVMVFHRCIVNWSGW